MEKRQLGGLLLVVGMIGVFLSLLMDTSVTTPYGSVHNIGLMNDKQNYLIVSGLVVICGVALFLLGSHETSPAPSGLRKCPACAEMIKLDAIKCRFCDTEVIPLPQTFLRVDDNSPHEMSDADLQNVADFYGIRMDGSEFIRGDERFSNLRDAVARAREEAGSL